MLVGTDIVMAMTTLSAKAKCKTISDQTSQLWSKTSSSGRLELTSTFEASLSNSKDPDEQDGIRQASNHMTCHHRGSSKLTVVPKDQS